MSNMTYEKVIKDGKIMFREISIDGLKCGTSVFVENIYKNLPVRLKSIRMENEIFQIKLFIQKLSLIHHRISWTLFSMKNRKSYLNLLPQSSVISRFDELHAFTMKDKLQVIILQRLSLFFRNLSNC
jgi:DNA mismatch repair ATPase MutL